MARVTAIVTLAAFATGAALPACAVQHSITATGAQIYAGLPQLRAGQPATIDAVDLGEHGTSVPVKATITPEQTVVVDAIRIPMRDLIASCGDAWPTVIDDTVDQPCALVHYRRLGIVVGGYHTHEVKPALILGAFGLAVAGIIAIPVCAADCHPGRLKTTTEIASGALVVLLIYAIVQAVRKHGFG